MYVVVNPPQPTPIGHLKELSRSELQRLWVERVGGGDPPQVKLLLLRDLAWNQQQAIPGGLDAPTQSLLKAAVRQARSDQVAGATSARRKPRTKRHGRKPQLQPGTRLIRTWRGQNYEVEVLEPDKRFAYRGQVYSSLTLIAQAITGAHWSGPRFFGLNRVRGIA